ncbi:hypothetical protein ACTFIZ_011276 [Dictyostelium cf. discoideum]
MKLNKSLLLLIVAIIASSKAAEIFSNFEVSNSAANSQCLTKPVELEVNTCKYACESFIKVFPVSNSTSKFIFNQQLLLYMNSLSDSSDSTRIGASFALIALALLSMFSL